MFKSVAQNTEEKIEKVNTALYKLSSYSNSLLPENLSSEQVKTFTLLLEGFKESTVDLQKLGVESQFDISPCGKIVVNQK